MSKSLEMARVVQTLAPRCLVLSPGSVVGFEDELGSQNTAQNIDTHVVMVTPAYSVFSDRRKKWTVWLMALTSWFSPASSFIYFPALRALADSLHVSVGKINVTVTSYLVVSAVAPAIIGSAADESGRRLVLVFSLIVYVVANIGLAVQRSYVAILLLRMLQSAGISGSLVARLLSCLTISRLGCSIVRSHSGYDHSE